MLDFEGLKEKKDFLENSPTFPLFSSKSMNIIHQDDFFSSFGPTYQSIKRYMGDSYSNPSNLTALFGNEWDIWAFFGPLVHKGDEG